MTDILDAGALIAAGRGNRAMWVRLKAAVDSGPLTHGGIVGQAWRDGSRQARLARFLPGVDVRPLTDDLGRAAGVLLAATGTADVVDAALVMLATDGDVILPRIPSMSRTLRPSAICTWKSSESEVSCRIYGRVTRRLGQQDGATVAVRLT